MMVKATSDTAKKDGIIHKMRRSNELSIVLL